MQIQTVTYPICAFSMQARNCTITDFIVHHTAGRTDQTPLEIDEEHRAIGDAMIAYNWVIAQDGTVYVGRPTSAIPAATYGRNEQSVAVVLIGNFQSDDPGFTGPPTAAQLDALLELCKWAHLRWPSICRTIGHRDVAPLFYPNDQGDYSTACPGDRLYDQLPDIRAKVRAQLGGR